MSPFVFPDDLEEGMRTSVVCSVVAGDPPITISWLKDGKPIEEMDSIQVVSITEFVSSLIINRLDRRFAGNYTCRASSDIGSVNYTGQMWVRSRPEWILKPTSQATVAGSGVRFDCMAQGHPQPVIRWRVVRKDPALINAAGSSQAGTGSGGSNSHHGQNNQQSALPVAILSSPRIHVLENGSLIIKTVQTEDQGKYTCESSNGVGKSQEASADLVVYETPKVRPASSQVTVRLTERIELVCRAGGSPPISFQWLKKDRPLNGVSPHLHSIRQETNGRDKISILTINMASRNESTVFSCIASNYFGSDKGHIKLLVQEPPDPPQDLRALEISSRSVSLSWTISYAGNSPVTGYEVVHKLTPGKEG